MTMIKIKLPEKLSDCIEVAVEDLIKCERSSKYGINMNSWHEPLNKNICMVCLAGSVMAKTLQVESNIDVEPENEDYFTEYNRVRLEALDLVRVGQFINAIKDMQLGSVIDISNKCKQLQDKYISRNIPIYEDDPGKFKRYLRKVARDLRDIGL